MPPFLRPLNLARAPAWKRPALVLATGFGLGLVPLASGTAGTLPGLLLMALLAPLWRPPVTPASLAAQALAALALCAAALPLCDAAEGHFGRKDDGRIVADEFLTFPLTLVGLPLSPWVVALAFFTHRLCDVIKPFPANGLQALPGGLGIVADDAVAALYSLALNHAVVALAARLAGS